MRTLLSKAIIVLTLLSTISCNKEPDKPNIEAPENGPKEIKLTKAAVVGSYVITKVEMATSGRRRDMTNEWFHSYAGDCAKDDITELKPDNSFVVIDSTPACEESTDDTGTWDVISNTKLRWDADTATIEECNSTLLRIVSPVYSSMQGDIIFTYTRQ